jgi:hypothetical protein
MSRIILSKYDNGEDKVVVGWDHPGGGAWWQEFNQEKNDKGVPIWSYDDSWQEVSRYGGYMNGISIDHFRDAVPDDIRPLITDEVLDLIQEHATDPNSGRIPTVVLVK